MIPTAEELYTKYNMTSENGFSTAIKLAKEFAKFHVEAALKAIAEKAKLKPYPYNSCDECGRSDMDVDKNSILNAYPLENIK
jgi:hypothetical protein